MLLGIEPNSKNRDPKTFLFNLILFFIFLFYLVWKKFVRRDNDKDTKI